MASPSQLNPLPSRPVNGAVVSIDIPLALRAAERMLRASAAKGRDGWTEVTIKMQSGEVTLVDERVTHKGAALVALVTASG
jgi:hypothetical protein